jgi:hypothetical protein
MATATRATASWVDALSRLRPRDRDRSRLRVVPDRTPERLSPQQACAITGAKRVKKKCCRSTPRCKGCPVVLMRAARAAESGLTGKELAKAVKRARAA